MAILFDVYEITRTADLDVADSTRIITECEGKDLEAEIVKCIETHQVEIDAEFSIEIACNRGTPLLNYI